MRYIFFTLYLTCTQWVLAESSIPAHWHQRSMPVTLWIGADMPQSMHGGLIRASQTWNRALGKTAIVVKCCKEEPKDIHTDNTNTVTWVTKTWPEKKEQEAVTYMVWSGTLMLEADIVINARDYAYSPSGIPKWNEVDFESLIVHELGHFLGLDHGSYASVMSPELSPGVIRRNLTAEDTRALYGIYPKACKDSCKIGDRQ